MTTGSSYRSSKTQDSARGAESILRALVVIIAVSWCCATQYGCGEPPRGQTAAVRPASPSLTLTPSQLHIGDLAFYQLRSEVIARHPRASCRRNDMGEQVCAWAPTLTERKHGYEGITLVTVKFVDDHLHEIGVAYGEMFDVEFTPFAEKVMSRWGKGIRASVADSSVAQWANDSLSITLLPKRKMHWTRTAYTYTPLITYRERMLRR
jgi:hypothetical protein